MSKKLEHEWFIPAPWGKIALISWGDPRKPPVLMIHGYMDSAATFIPLVEHLPDTYYYVALDVLGHGLSDTIPGPPPTMVVATEMVRLVVNHMKWDQFICLTHSIGVFLGLLYNAIEPDRITKFISIDPEKAISLHYYTTFELGTWWQFFYEEYYDDYKRYNAKSKLYTLEEAIKLVARNRSLTEEQATVTMGRYLGKEGDKYRFLIDPRMKKVSSFPIADESLHYLMSTNVPPTLVIVASEGNEYSPKPAKDFASTFLANLVKSKPEFTVANIEAKHDVHITHPKEIAGFIIKFLGGERKSKL